jgi:molybdate transport system regulatory protein
MSYMRAWNLVQDLNRDVDRPIVKMSRGGASGGAAEVTAFGKRILALYQAMERKSSRAANPYSRKLARLLG